MRNDISFPPPPGDPDGPTPPPPAAGAVRGGRVPAVGGHGGLVKHPHPDRAHSLERTSDKPATDTIYETPEDRGGIDSTILSTVVVAGVAIVVLVVAFIIYRHL